LRKKPLSLLKIPERKSGFTKLGVPAQKVWPFPMGPDSFQSLALGPLYFSFVKTHLFNHLEFES
jgi:hypothetical protein